MIENLKTGITHTEETVVTYNKTAAFYGSGLIEVFATPAMIALMERTALIAVQKYLPEGYNTVGTEINVRHFKATPLSMKVVCEARLDKIEGKKLYFSVEARDEEGPVGSGTHCRYVINIRDFMERLKK